MNRSSIHITALALALALYVSDSRAQQQPPSQSTPPSSTSPSTGPQRTPPSTTPRSTSPSATQRQSQTSAEGTIAAQAFVQQLYEDNQKEIEISRMANTKAQAKEVKDYAKQLVDDHTKSQDKLRKYAMEKNITLRSTSPSSTRSSQDPLGATSPSTTRSPSSTSPSTQSEREPSTASTQSGRNEPTPGTRRSEPSQGTQTGRSESTVGEHEAGSARAQSDSADSHVRELSSKSGAEFDRAYVQMMVDDHQKAAAMLARQKSAKAGDSDLQGIVNDQLSMVKKHLNKAEDIQKDLQKNLNSTDSKSDSKSEKSRTPSSTPSRTPSTDPSRTPGGPSTR